MSEELDFAGYELVKDMEDGGTACFYYGYDPRTSLSSDVYKTVNPLVRLEDHQRKVAEERSRKYDEGFFEGRKAQREDVKALIQSKDFTIQQEIRKGRHEKAIKLIDELLEEVEGEASE